jgi:Zn-dependent protease
MNASIIDWLASMAITLPVIIASLSVHEFAHAITATICGDNTPSKDGRVTLNPMAHIDYLGLLFVLIFRFGWAKPVIFDPRNFKHSKTFSLLTALAGPIANFILALACMYALRLLSIISMPLAVYKTFTQIFQAGAIINVIFGIFNFLPIPPLDGGHLLMVILDEKAPEAALWFRQNSFLIMLSFFLFFSFIARESLTGCYSACYKFLTKLVFI